MTELKDIDVESRVAAGNRVNGALAALMRRRNVRTAARWPYTMQFRYRRIYGMAVIWQRNWVGITEVE